MPGKTQDANSKLVRWEAEIVCKMFRITYRGKDDDVRPGTIKMGEQQQASKAGEKVLGRLVS